MGVGEQAAPRTPNTRASFSAKACPLVCKGLARPHCTEGPRGQAAGSTLGHVLCRARPLPPPLCQPCEGLTHPSQPPSQSHCDRRWTHRYRPSQSGGLGGRTAHTQGAAQALLPTLRSPSVAGAAGGGLIPMSAVLP